MKKDDEKPPRVRKEVARRRPEMPACRSCETTGDDAPLVIILTSADIEFLMQQRPSQPAAADSER